ncbi:MAG: SDR family oxidoreductase [Roseburia sp.]|nr:SDR family oxidoreductase [Roseburia sp.]
MKTIIALNGKKILVTGASSGIGRETAILLSQIGAKVVAVARNQEALQETLSMMEGEGHYCIACDLSQTEKIEELVNEAVSYDGQKLDGLVHCAGITKTCALRMLSIDKIDEVMRINYYSFIELMRQYEKKKNNNGGSVVAISSKAAKSNNKGQLAYAPSKAALNSAVKVLAKELAHKNIRVNSIMPGFIHTKMANDYFNQADRDSVNQLLGVGEPIDIANMAAYLLSDAGKFITGAGMVIDGGSF